MTTSPLLFLTSTCIVLLQSSLAFPSQGYQQLLDGGTSRNDVLSDHQFSSLEDIDRPFEDLNMFNQNDLLGQRPDIGDPSVSKRPFCNGFSGCGRSSGKRAIQSKSLPFNNLHFSSETLMHDSTPSANAAGVPSIAKRPFCNGFFGCGNPGKRIVIRHTGFTPAGLGTGVDKRRVCNGSIFDCYNERMLNARWKRSARNVSQ